VSYLANRETKKNSDKNNTDCNHADSNYIRLCYATSTKSGFIAIHVTHASNNTIQFTFMCI